MTIIKTVDNLSLLPVMLVLTFLKLKTEYPIIHTFALIKLMYLFGCIFAYYLALLTRR